MRIVIWLSVKLHSASILFFNPVFTLKPFISGTWTQPRCESGCPFKELHIEATDRLSQHCWGDEVGKEQKDLKIESHVYFGNSEKLLLPELENSNSKSIFCGLLTVYLHPMCRFNNFQDSSLDKYAGMTKVVLRGSCGPQKMQKQQPKPQLATLRRGWEQPVGWEPGKSSQKWAKSCIQSY